LFDVGCFLKNSVPFSAPADIYYQMPELDDIALVKQFAENGSEPAFAEIVSRHVNLVYSAARRKVGDAHAAQEISQAVFIILARKAKSLGAKTVLSGWLYQTARLTAANYLRGEIRRQKRDQEAFMQSTLNEHESQVWLQIAPVLDDALSKLGAKDRDAIVLRFFENKSLGEVGAAMNTSEDAAKMRVNRALEKLRKLFTKRGVVLSGVIIAGAVSAHSVQAAPVALAKSVTVVAVTKGAVASGSTLTLVKEALKIMAWTKAKMAIVVGAGLLLAAGTTSVAIEKFTSPSIEDVFKHFSEGGYLKKAPPVGALRPSRGGQSSVSSTDARTWLCHAWDWLCHGGQTGGTNTDIRMAARAVPLGVLMSFAYGSPDMHFHWSANRVILPPDGSNGKFDFLLTVPVHPQEALQAEIKKQLGLAAHREMRDADVLVLRVSNSSAIRLTAAKGGNSSDTRPGRGRFEFTNEPIDYLRDFLEDSLGKPVIDETESTQNYSGSLQWNPQSDKAAELKEIQNALSGRLGLELVPSREPVEMLVVEKPN
jgi:uncharacterized protein (TIGR03435 family)